MLQTDSQEDILRAATALFNNNPDWVTFYREILGLYGVVRKHCPTREALLEFEQTDTYAEVQHMLRKLREKLPVAESEQDPTSVITVRLPKSLHEALRSEAYEHQTSMNKLCISKLLQIIDSQLVPTDRMPKTTSGGGEKAPAAADQPPTSDTAV